MIDRILARLRKAHDEKDCANAAMSKCALKVDECSCDVARDLRGFEQALKDVVFVVDDETMAAFERLVTGLTITHQNATERDVDPPDGFPLEVKDCPCRLAQDIRAFLNHVARLEKNRTQAAYLQGGRPTDETVTGLEDTARQPDDEQTGRDEAKRRMYDAVAADLPASSPEDVRAGKPGAASFRAFRSLVDRADQIESELAPETEPEDGTSADFGPVRPTDDTIDKPGSTPRPAERRPYVQPEDLRRAGEVRAADQRQLTPEDVDRYQTMIGAKGWPPRALNSLTERSPEDCAGMVSAGNDAFDRPASSPRQANRPYASGGHIPEPSDGMGTDRSGEPSEQAAREEKEGIWAKMTPAEAERVRSKARFGRFGVSVDIHRDAVGKVLVAVHVGSDTGTILFDKRHYDALRSAFPPLGTLQAPDRMPEPSRSEELPAGKDWVSVTELRMDFDDFAPAIRDAVFRMFGAAMEEVFALAARQADEMGVALRELGAALSDDEKPER